MSGDSPNFGPRSQRLKLVMLFPAPHTLKVGLVGHNYELRALLVYERFLDATRAMALMNRVCEQLGDQYQVSIDTVKFNLLAHSWMRSATVEMANRANLIFLAASGRTDLPPHVASWIAAWLRKASDSGALIGVFDEGSVGETAIVRAYLSRIAAQSGMQFFCNLEGLMPAHVRLRSQVSSSGDGGARERGLNER